ncbi:uncharacterized protein EV422DRAFT_537896 [Fimicolochytrium jonesii]|uniref:uncharacterized protein n=1 Tax=Fimicolochytrium jonesii TaxID=1396493 RepID=UPI0022FEF287|nr:uncharacterized protein EV422DRAFT_537896 [Fimicolochytrium jonesii]KAI8818275.1 hypothetical protein EV422DRAFT_537896 [Fimicolochytrium jonesii]
MGRSNVLDELLSYNTFKVVRVKDKYLGGLYYGFLVAISAYILYQIIGNKLYLASGPVIAGEIRMSLEPPEDYGQKPPPAYCGADGTSCLYWDPAQIMFPVPDQGGMFLTTRVTILTYPDVTIAADGTNANCTYILATSPNCSINQVKPISSKTYFIANLEEFTIMVEHSVRSDLLRKSTHNREMTGEIVYAETNTPIYKFDSTYQRTSNASGIPGDVFPVSTMLQAAGVDLDGKSMGLTAKPGDTVRTRGMVITVAMNYENVGVSNDLFYTYRPSKVELQQYKIIEERVDLAGGHYLSLNRHGIRLELVQTGIIGKFNLMALLRNLVAAGALLTVATFIVERVMLWLLPLRQKYRRHKYENTRHFTDVWKAFLAKRRGIPGPEILPKSYGSHPRGINGDRIVVDEDDKYGETNDISMWTALREAIKKPDDKQKGPIGSFGPKVDNGRTESVFYHGSAATKPQVPGVDIQLVKTSRKPAEPSSITSTVAPPDNFIARNVDPTYGHNGMPMPPWYSSPQPPPVAAGPRGAQVLNSRSHQDHRDIPLSSEFPPITSSSRQWSPLAGPSHPDLRTTWHTGKGKPSHEQSLNYPG